MSKVVRKRKPVLPPSTPLAALMEKHLDDLLLKNYSEYTIKGRRVHIGFFLDWAAERGIGDPVEVTRTVLEAYQRHVFNYRKKNGEPLGFNGQHDRIVPLRVWFKWMARQHHILHNPASELELPRVGMRLPKAVLTASEAERILQQPNIHDPLGLRDRAIMETLYTTGMRRLELVNLKLWDLDLERATVANRYSYGVNNPLSIVDKNGLWPTWVHNQIINEAFPGLSADQLKNLQTASKNVDSDQGLAGAAKHGMANGQDPNGAVHAEMDSDEFIRKNQHDAESIQADWIASGHTGIAPGALTAFGNALHTITDKTSPSHESFQPWYGVGLFDLPEAGYHFVREAWPWGGNQQRQQNAVNAARAAYLLVFGSDAASQAETPKKKEDVKSTVCYQTDNGQVCQ